MSEIKVNKITPRTDCGTTQLGDSGDTVTVTGDLRSNSLKASDGGVIISQSGTNITIGASGDTVSLASGASQSGFGRTGTVDWQTGSIKTATFTAASGEGYFCNTSGGAFTVNLPAGSAGAIVSVSDYTRTFQTNSLTVSPNGSEKIGGIAEDASLSTEGQTATFVYVDSTEGWINIQETSNSVTGQTFITATGGTITTSGNDKIHTFTGPGTFCVSQIATCSANNQVSYLVIAGAGGGGNGESGAGHPGGGGGAGGFREDKSPVTPYTASPLEGAGAISVTATGFPITVGGGGSGGSSTGSKGGDGNNSVFSTITSALGAGGGAGSNSGPNRAGGDGGSGAGSGSSNSPPAAGGAGNTPPVSPPQGNPGGPGAQTSGLGGSGGGATAAGTQYPGSASPHPGGAGAATSITASPVTYSVGGSIRCSSGTGPNGGDNTGTGGGGGLNNNGGNGGSGVVIIRYKFQ